MSVEAGILPLLINRFPLWAKRAIFPDLAAEYSRYAHNDVESSPGRSLSSLATAIGPTTFPVCLSATSDLEDTEMLRFRIEGPFEIEPIHEAGGKLIQKTSVDKFWSDDGKSHLEEAVGCYVFGFRAGSGLVPVYVGQSKTGFKNECFQHHKLTHYNNALVKRRRGTPIMFFVVKDEGATSVFEACIGVVEHFLIQNALARNPGLENVQLSDWIIQGVYRSTPGGQSDSARLFRKFLGISPDHETESDDETDLEDDMEATEDDAEAAEDAAPLPTTATATATAATVTDLPSGTEADSKTLASATPPYVSATPETPGGDMPS